MAGSLGTCAGYIRHHTTMIKRYTLLLPVVLLAMTSYAQPTNDECVTAISVTCGQTVSGSTSLALPDEATNCGTSVGAPGVWYVLQGTDAMVTATTCPDNTYDTKLNVYVGNCGTITCVAGNDDIAGGVLCSSVSFAAPIGQTFYILVQGYNGAVGAFDLAITCEPLNEDVCQGALPIACGGTVQGTTTGANEDLAPECGTSISSAGVWYTFPGTGGQMTLSTCPNNTYDTKLNVYSGDCTELECVAGNDDITGGVLCSSVTFLSALGTSYHVLVQGYDGETGDFELSLTCVSCGVPQSVTATPTDVSAVINWSSVNTTPNYLLEYGPAGFAPGTGTVVTGTYGVDGPPVNITGLTASTEYDIYLTEDCGGGDLSTTVGPTTFTTLAFPPAPNAICSGAVTITCAGEVIGNTEAGFPANVPTCGAANPTTNGLWYTFTGNGDDVTLSTCAGSSYDTKLSVFSGTCLTPVCVGGSDDAPGCPGNTSRVVIPTIAGTSYLVFVHGYNDAQGAFTLSMTCSAPCGVVENDQCGSATELSIQIPGGCEASTGTTVCAYAAATANPPCDPFGNIVDTWYRFNTGWAMDLSLLLEPGTAVVLNAAIYTACDGAYIECWNDVTDPIDLSALPANTEVLLRVWNGGGPDAGTFTVCVEGDFNVGLTELASERVALYPVPTKDHLDLRGSIALENLTITDTQGRSILDFALNGVHATTIDVTSLAPGNYVVLNNGLSIGRFVKN